LLESVSSVVFVVFATFSLAVPIIIVAVTSDADIVVSLLEATIFVKCISPFLVYAPAFVLKVNWKIGSSVLTNVPFVNVIFPTSAP